MPSQEEWIVRAARLFPSPTPDHIRTSDIPLVLICLDINDDDMSIRRALGVGRIREIPIANLVRVLTPILPAENSASERYTMFRVFDEYGNGTVSLEDLQRVALGARLLTARECERIMQSLSNTSHGITFDHWCTLLRDIHQPPATPQSQSLSGTISPGGRAGGGSPTSAGVDLLSLSMSGRSRGASMSAAVAAASSAAADGGISGRSTKPSTPTSANAPAMPARAGF